MKIDSRHVSPWAINMHRRGHDLDCRYDEKAFSSLPFLPCWSTPTSLTFNQSHHTIIHYKYLFYEISAQGCVVCPLPHTHKHIRTYAPPTSGKIVLVNEIRLNHALAFHQSLCDGCSPLIHGFHPIRLLPVCADMSNDPPYLAPHRAVDLRDNHRNRGSPLSITLSKNIHNHTRTRILNVWLLPPSSKVPILQHSIRMISMISWEVKKQLEGVCVCARVLSPPRYPRHLYLAGPTRH